MSFHQVISANIRVCTVATYMLQEQWHLTGTKAFDTDLRNFSSSMKILDDFSWSSLMVKALYHHQLAKTVFTLLPWGCKGWQKSDSQQLKGGINRVYKHNNTGIIISIQTDNQILNFDKSTTSPSPELISLHTHYTSTGTTSRDCNRQSQWNKHNQFVAFYELTALSISGCTQNTSLIPAESIQGQVGWDWASWSSVRRLAHSRVVGTTWFLRFLPTQSTLWFFKRKCYNKQCLNPVAFFFFFGYFMLL